MRHSSHSTAGLVQQQRYTECLLAHSPLIMFPSWLSCLYTCSFPTFSVLLHSGQSTRMGTSSPERRQTKQTASTAPACASIAIPQYFELKVLAQTLRHQHPATRRQHTATTASFPARFKVRSTAKREDMRSKLRLFYRGMLFQLQVDGTWDHEEQQSAAYGSVDCPYIRERVLRHVCDSWMHDVSSSSDEGSDGCDVAMSRRLS